jgi:hypothetical protein
MHVELGLSDDLIGIVELVRFGKMGDIAGMNHEGRLGRHRLHLGNGLAQRAERIRVSRLAEADMAVADLQEGEARRFRGQSVAKQAQGFRHTARQRPQHPGPRPDHTFERAPSAYARLISFPPPLVTHHRLLRSLACAPRDKETGVGDDLFPQAALFF